MSNLDTIVNFLRSQGLNSNAIAGIVGNLQIESSLDPTAHNEKENAIGIGQWEGSRRTALQQFARLTGGSETSLNTQLHFLWDELTQMNMMDELNRAGSAAQAATIWDQQYERSSGSSRQQRINAANAYASGNLSAFSNANNSGGGGSTGFDAGSLPNPTAADFQQAEGALGGLLKTVPELRGLLQQAVSGGWATSKFQQAVEQTHWYRSHNEATRTLLALQASDPTEYKTQLTASWNKVSQMAGQLGVRLSHDELASFGMRNITEGWDQQTLQKALASVYRRNEQPTGQAAAIYQQLAQVYGQYGQPTNFAQLQYRTQQVLAGGTTVDTYKQDAITKAKAMFPGLTQQLDSGLTVQDAADPYKQSMSQILEINPQTINLSDPLIKRALQGQVNSIDAKGNRNYLPTNLSDFEQTLRNDPRWQYTQNAKDTMSSALLHIGNDFGFGPTG